MNRLFISISFLIALVSCEKSNTIDPAFYSCSLSYSDSSFSNPNNQIYQDHLDQMTNQGVVGITMSVYTPNKGMWLGTSGKADLRNDVPLHPCNITRVGSTVKLFTATLILKLAEEDKLDLDKPLSDYITGKSIHEIENAEQASIRQLLQHSSGIYNYIQNLKFQTASLNDLVKEWTAEELLRYAEKKPAYFEPGSDVKYSNTNYILLGLLIEKIEGKPLYQVFDEKLFFPLGLESTTFAGKNPVPRGIIRGYVDLYSNLQIIESTYFSGWDYYTADGGLISNPYDMNVFFRALMNGQIINQGSLSQMLDWKTPKKTDAAFYDISYGLGIFKMETEKGTAYFHSGDAIGYYANMLYFPSDGTTLVYAVNSNYGKIDAKVSTKEAIGRIIQVVKD